MAYLISNIPHFKCWVRREFTHNHEKYHDEYLHCLVIAVNTIPDRSLSFQVVFTGCESDCDDNDEPNIIYYTEAFKYEIIDDKEYSYFYLFDLNTMEDGSFVNVLDITDKVNNSSTINIQLMVDKTQIDKPNNSDLILKINIIDGYLGISFPTNELLYKIESSIDLIEWKTITQFNGNNDIYYYLTDDKLTNNRKFYRVKSID